MHPINEFIAKWRQEVRHWRERLDEMERSKMHIGDFGGADTTPESIEIYRNMISRVEADIDRAEKELQHRH